MDNRFSQFAGRLKPSAIRRVSRAVHGKTLVSFAGGLPHPDTFPVAELREIAEEIFTKRFGEALQYGLTQGYLPFIEQVIAYLAGRGIRGLSPGNVLIAAGSQQALDLVGRVLIDPGDPVFVESPGYVGALSAFANLGARLAGIPLLADGPDLEMLESALERERPKFLHFTPNFSNPSGTLMSPEKRHAVYELASRYDVWIVEDDAYGELFFAESSPSEVVPWKAADPDGRVIYLHTFSKTIVPGLRLAAIVAPEEVISLVEMAKQAADMFTGGFTQCLAAEFMRRGAFQERLPKLRAFYQARRDAMAGALDRFLTGAHWHIPRGGFFIWLEFPDGLDAAELLPAAIEAGVAYVPGASFHTDCGSEIRNRTARLAFSRETEADIVRGVERLGGVVEGALKRC